MRRPLAFALFAAVTAGSIPSMPARAAVTAETAEVLALQCRAVSTESPDVPLGKIGSPDAVQCLAYVIGVFDTLRAFDMNARDKFLCVPEAAIAETHFAKVYLDWFARNPQHAESYPTGPVIAALPDAFPCRAREEGSR